MLNIHCDGQRISIGERFSVSFQRTLRIPDDGKVYPLPPGLGAFPVLAVKDYPNAPKSWQKLGGYFIPMYQREALWLGFDAAHWKPSAVQIGIGGINAVTGKAFKERLSNRPQNYLVCPDQPWLDGINVGEGVIRQFVAMRLGGGYTVEAQIAGREELGGIQIRVYEPKPGRFPDKPPPEPEHFGERAFAMAEASGSMGLGAGGQMEQKIYPDSYGLDTWDTGNFGSVHIHILNSQQYRAVTGLEAPPSPISAQTYTQYGFPWFELYDENLPTLAGTRKLKRIKSVREVEKRKGLKPREEEEVEVKEEQIKKLKHGRKAGGGKREGRKSGA